MTTFTTEDRESAQNGPRPRTENVCPCDECEHAPLCKSSLLACRPFGTYVAYNYFFTEATRIPSRGTYKKIFDTKEDAKELREYLKQFIEEEDGHKAEDNAKE
jgi:hypothetical protein